MQSTNRITVEERFDYVPYNRLYMKYNIHILHKDNDHDPLSDIDHNHQFYF